MNGIEVAIRDMETGEEETQVIPMNDYLVICTGRCYVASEQNYPMSGTTNITIKTETPEQTIAKDLIEELGHI